MKAFIQKRIPKKTSLFVITCCLLTSAIAGCSLLNSKLSDKDISKIQSAKKQKPNILWIVTDDQRPDTVSAYNKVMYGTKNSPLGYVESPNTDKLAAEGVLFTQAFTNSPVCGPSRGSMHSGRYPFRNGHYAFELTHQAPDFVKPVVSEVLRDNGYGTSVFGKEDHYIYKWGPGQGFNNAQLFDHKVHFKHDLNENGLGEIFIKPERDQKSKKMRSYEYVYYADGRHRKYAIDRLNKGVSEQDLAEKAKTEKEFDILRAHTRFNTMLILGGENPKPADETVDANIVKSFKNYLANADKSYDALWGKKIFQGADTSKPQFLHLGFHLPHSPVLPPKSFRDRFKNKTYKVPDFSPEELKKLPTQLAKLYNGTKMKGMSDDEVQQAIQDYYAFCAFGDYLIGQAVDAFKAYNKKHNQEYIIVYTVGDHGWHLGEQGIEAKFGPWQQSVGNAAIVVSSDKSLLPANKVNTDLVEFVDFAPTIMQAAGIDTSVKKFDYLDGYSLFDVYNGKVKRDYILGEINVIVGPRAYLHNKRFRFSMRTRPFSNIMLKPEQLGHDIKWALNVPAKEAELALYDLAVDPLEQNNVAYDEKYKKLALWFRNKLGNIVLGDKRIEADWSQENTYYLGDFALGADDKKLDIPAEIIPKV